MSRRAIREAPGFTLLEVIMAAAIVGIVAFSLFASLQTAYRARENTRAAMDPVRAVHVALELIGRDLEGVLEPKGILAGPFIGLPQTEGQGRADSLEFYRMAPLATAADLQSRLNGIQRMELGLGHEPGDTLPVLARLVTSNLLAPTEEIPETEILCRHVRSFGIQYFDGTVWQENWDSTTLGDTLPVAVQVSLVVEWPGWRSAAPTVYSMMRTFLLTDPMLATSTTAASSTSGSSSTKGGS